MVDEAEFPGGMFAPFVPAPFRLIAVCGDRDCFCGAGQI
jgi:hypothetical protein